MQQIVFTVETKYGPFCDAIYLEENHNFTEAEILVMQQQRVENWIKIIEKSSSEAAPVIDDLSV